MGELVKLKDIGLIRVAPGERITSVQIASAYKDMMEFAKHNTPTGVMIRNSENTSIAKCMDSGECSLAATRKAFGHDSVLAYIELWIIDLVKFFNVKREMTPDQIKQTAFMFYEDAYYLNLSEINLFMTRLKKGHYGKLYSEMDGSIILRCLHEFLGERLDEAEQVAMREHDRTKQDPGERSSVTSLKNELRNDEAYKEFKRNTFGT